MVICFAATVDEPERTHALRVLSAAHAGDSTISLPWGYVYRSLYADGHSYVGKRKIYPGSEWMDYVGSGKNLDPSRVVRKEFVCFGATAEETHDLECKWIQYELDHAVDRSMVLNLKVDVVDSTIAHKHESEEELNKLRADWGDLIVDLYLSLGSEQRTADYVGCPRKVLHRRLVELGVSGYGRAVCYSKKVGGLRHSSPYDGLSVSSPWNLRPSSSDRFLRYPDDTLFHWYADSRHHYGRVCAECGETFESVRPDDLCCSLRCKHLSQQFKPEDRLAIEAMLSDGESALSIGRRFGVSEHAVYSYVKHVLHRPTRFSGDVGYESACRRSGRWTMHVRWHVRRNKLDMVSCEYCQRHEGFDEATAAMAADRMKTCKNPLCHETFIGDNGDYCSEECARKTKHCKSMFAAHMSRHVRRDAVNDSCWFCANGVNDVETLHAIDFSDVMTELLARSEHETETVS